MLNRKLRPRLLHAVCLLAIGVGLPVHADALRAPTDAGQLPNAGIVHRTAPAAGIVARAVNADGTVVDWGANSSGELGNSTFTGSDRPVAAGNLSGVTALAGGFGDSLALKADGTVWAWGDNDDGELGDGTTTTRNLPVQVSDFTGITAIAAGSYHSLAVKSDGTAWAWGDNSSGQLGKGDALSVGAPAKVADLTGVTGIAGGAYHSLAVKGDGTVWAWGSNAEGQLGNSSVTHALSPMAVSGLSGVVAVACGYDSSLALKSDGTVWAWGENTFGDLGDGSINQRNAPVQVSNLSGVTAIAAGQYHSLALKSDGTVWAWGGNASGQLGDGNKSDSPVAVQVNNLNGVTAIASGETHSVALKGDGTVWAWGSGGDGELGAGNQSDSDVPVRVLAISGTVPLSAVAIAAGGNHSMAVAGSPAVLAVVFTAPAKSATVTTLPLISGTATDSPSGQGLTSVTFTLKRNSDGKFWSGSAWGTTAAALTTSLTNGNWQRNSALPAGANLVPGVYTLVATVSDKAAGQATASETFTVVADKTAPAVSITSPAKSAVINGSLPPLQATVTDEAGGSGVGTVQFFIRRVGDGSWWSGTAWGSAATPLPSTAGANNQYTCSAKLPSPTVTGTAKLTDGSYLVYVWGFDKAGNKTVVSSPFTEQNDAGVAISINTPTANSTVGSLTVLSATTTDKVGGSGTSKVDFYLHQPNGNWWTGTKWSNTLTPLHANGSSGTWSYSGTLPTPSGTTSTKLVNGKYTLFAWATDTSGKVIKTQSTFTVQAVPVTVTITSPANNATITGTTTLTAATTGLVGTVQFYLRQPNGNWWSGSKWTGVVTPLAATLSAGKWNYSGGYPQPGGASDVGLVNGSYTLFAWANDSSGRVIKTQISFNVQIGLGVAIAITTPADKATVAGLSALAATTTDKVGGSGTSKVDFYLRQPNGNWWTGTKWSGVVTPLSATGSNGNWTRSSALPTPPGGGNGQLVGGAYTLFAWATDKTGAIVKTQSTFTVQAAPKITISITAPANGATVGALPEVDVSTSDDQGGDATASVQVFVRRSDGQWWNGTTWAGAVTPLDTTSQGAGAWARVGALPTTTDDNEANRLTDGSYLVYAWAFDSNGRKTVYSQPFTVQAGQGQVVRSNATLSSAEANAATGTITLNFTARLDAATAGEVADYTVSSDGTAVPVQAVRLSGGSAVTLQLPPGKLRSGTVVQVGYNLRDSRGGALRGTARVPMR